MNITTKPASPNNYSIGRFGQRINLVVVHTMAGYLNGTASWFANPASRVSAHYGVGLDGDKQQYVSEQNTAWHAGNLDFNLRSVGIEFEDDDNPMGVERPASQYQAGAQLIAQICLRYGIPCDRAHIIGHREVPGNDHPNCPGNENIDALVQAAAVLCAPPPPPVDPVQPVQSPKTGTVTVTAKPWVWLRTGPGTGYAIANGKDGSGNIIHYVPYNVSFEYVDVVHGESIGGNPNWLKTIRGNYVTAAWTTYKG